MDTGMWPVLPDAERVHRNYLPGQALGPLRMDMHQIEVIAALAAHGYTAQPHGRSPGWDTVHFTEEDVPTSQAPVECHFHTDGELAHVRVDGRLGTQRTGDHIISSALFFVAGDDHSVTRDNAPETVWHRW
ncbi:hypothetical protein [Streptomyces sp. NPDC005009]